MKIFCAWALLLIGLLGFANMPTQTAQAATDATSTISLTITPGKPTLPDTDVEPDVGKNGRSVIRFTFDFGHPADDR